MDAHAKPGCEKTTAYTLGRAPDSAYRIAIANGIEYAKNSACPSILPTFLMISRR